MIPTLETERLRLRGWSEADLEPVASFWADEAAARFMGGVKTRDEAWRSIALHLGHWQMRGYGQFVIEERTTARLAGWCGPWFPGGWPEPELGWGLLPAFQGRGYATEAASAARRHAYERLGWTTAISLIDPANTPSLRVAERLHATFETLTPFRGKEVGIHRHPGPDSIH